MTINTQAFFLAGDCLNGRSLFLIASSVSANLQRFGRYIYTKNDVTDRTDPNGLAPFGQVFV